ncbi:MAG: nuclear transport factor 2 family protein [Methanoregulaceae archaeon]|nr:nuclear transport factor 2 family protein [Methanoregulaceae archaeon]
MSFILALPLLLGQTSDMKPWQARYDALVAAMKALDSKKATGFMHAQYTEVADGVVLNRAEVVRRMPERLKLVGQYGQKPKVLKVNVIGNTATVSVEMNFKAVMTENKKKVTYTSMSRLSDTWLKVNNEFKLYRSVVETSVTKRDGKVVTAPKTGG